MGLDALRVWAETKMRIEEICHHLDQIAKLRAKLRDTVNPPEQIRKPVGMRTLVFQNRIERLLRHEHAAERKFLDGLRRFTPTA